MLRELSSIGIDEIACLIDFGLSVEAVIESLDYLVRLHDLCGNAPTVPQTI